VISGRKESFCSKTTIW